MRRAKIIATLGPALDDPVRLRAAIEAGADVFRFNFSHGTVEDHRERIRLVRELGQRVGRVVGTLGDLQGPKIRLGAVAEGGVVLETDHRVVLVAGESALTMTHDEDGVPVLPVVYPALADDVSTGSLVLIDDGSIRLVVESSDPVSRRVHAKVVVGGTATSRKGVNLPGVQVSAPSLTEKDREDLANMVELGIDWIALSFVRRVEDVLEVRALIEQLGGQQPVIAKLERPEVLDDLEAIVAASDAIMVARGDLGVEIGPERVPAIQKEIIDLSNRLGRPVITATEMLESMIRSPRPTRAEASDVANAIFDGSDAVMLSGETAAGKYPVEAVRTMARIIEVAESSRERVRSTPPETAHVLGRSVAKAATQIADEVDAVAILVFSLSGASVQLVSKYRPQQRIVGLTPDERALRRFALMWGTDGAIVPTEDRSLDLMRSADEVCRAGSIGRVGDRVVIVAGVPGGHGGTNRVIVHELGDETNLTVGGR
ncbi:MAG: pyruvate kinase [Actinomycetota bacterium]|nr:pyruvate kinase [Actinomycetota bacterium]